jgi:hypothetical protein
MNELPAAKIKMMKASVRCLLFGVLSLLPLIGLPFGLAALWLAGRVRAQEKQLWNAAKPYRMFGVLAAGVGTLLGTGVLGYMLIHTVLMTLD